MFLPGHIKDSDTSHNLACNDLDSDASTNLYATGCPEAAIYFWQPGDFTCEDHLKSIEREKALEAASIQVLSRNLYPFHFLFAI